MSVVEVDFSRDFTVVLYVNPLTPRVKPCFLTFDSMDRTLKRDHSLLRTTLLWCYLVFDSTQFVIIENSSFWG